MSQNRLKFFVTQNGLNNVPILGLLCNPSLNTKYIQSGFKLYLFWVCWKLYIRFGKPLKNGYIFKPIFSNTQICPIWDSTAPKNLTAQFGSFFLSILEYFFLFEEFCGGEKVKSFYELHSPLYLKRMQEKFCCGLFYT